jgi:hypothetical protein
LDWAKEHLNWTKEDWHKVMWTDESPFVIRFQRKSRVWRLHNERYEPWATKQTVKHDKKINVWGAFAANGVGRLYRVNGILEKKQYNQILIHQMLPSARKLFPDIDESYWILQQDNDPKHTAKLNVDWLADNQVITFHWPSQSPDLNPIENLWSILDERCKGRTCNTEDQLMEVLTEAWNALPDTVLTSLVDSMPNRCQEVIDSNGFATRY